MQQRDTFCIFDRFSKLVLSWSWVDVFCSTKNRLKLKKLDKNCNQSIISKEHHLIVIFQRTQMRFVVASKVPLVLDLDTFFTAGISAEMLPGYWLQMWDGDSDRVRSLMDIVADILLRVSLQLVAARWWRVLWLFFAWVQISFKISVSAAEIKLDLKLSSRIETTDLCFGAA